MKQKFLMIGVAGLILAGCATTENRDRQELVDAGQLTGERSDGSRVRCESVRVTGSRMSERICLTERQWEDMNENAQQLRRDRDEQNNVTLPGQGGFGDADGASIEQPGS